MLKSKMLGYRETCQMRPQKGEEMNNIEANRIINDINLKASMVEGLQNNIYRLETDCARLKALCRDLWKQLDEQIDYHDLEARIKQEEIE